MTMSERLRARTDQLDIKQNELAKKIGVSPTTLNGYFTGYRVPDAQTLIALASNLDISIDYLLTGKESAQKNDFPISEEDAMKQEIIDILNQLPPEAYPRAQKILEAVFEVPPKLPLK